MKKYTKKKGFTIVELVIVIAVVGVLTAVLVPTFVNLANRAKEADNQSFVRNINTQLAMNEADKGFKNSTMEDSIKLAQSMGFDVTKITPYNNNDIVWDSVHDRFAILKSDYAQDKNQDKDHVVYADASFDVETPLYKLWKVYAEYPKEADQTYSIYAKEAEAWDNAEITNLKVGFDAGKNAKINSIHYVGSGNAQNTVIRTNSFATTLTINAPADTVNHYGNAAIVDVEKIAGASYHENGTVGRLTVEEGHAVAESNATIFCFIDAGSDTTATVEVKSGAVVYDENGESKGQEAVVEGTHDDCGTGHHDFGSQLVIDNKVYEVCKSCGYTLVHVVDEVTGEDTLTTKVDSTNNVVNTPVETFNNSTDSVNEDGTVKVDAIPSVAAIDASNINTSCSHEFGDPVVVEPTCYAEGSKTYTCTKCGSTMIASMAKTAHRFYDDGSEYEKCLYHSICHTDRGDAKVAKIGNTEYSTLREAIAAVADNTETTIVMIADEAIYGNSGYTIAVNKNVTIDLNGHTIKNFVTENKASALLTVKGTLTIKDSSDTNKDGTGYGIICNDYDRANENIHVGEWWGTPQYNYATNVITNSGTLTIESGRIHQTAAGSICYAVDNNSTSYDTTLNVNGGLISDAYGTAVRMFCNSTTKENIINMNGGAITTPGYAGLWIQLPGSSGQAKKATVNISGGLLKARSYAFYDTTGGDVYTNVSYNISGGTFNGMIFSYGANFEITGGSFNGEVAIKQAKASNVSVTGGTFASDLYTYGDNASEGFITGGTFLTYTYEYEGETYNCDWTTLISETHEIKDNGNGTWTVVQKAE